MFEYRVNGNQSDKPFILNMYVKFKVEIEPL